MRVPKKNAFSGEVTHPDRNKHSSDWSVNSFKMVINEEFFFQVQNFLSQSIPKNNFYYKTIYGPVRIVCTSSSCYLLVIHYNHKIMFCLASQDRLIYFLYVYFVHGEATAKLLHLFHIHSFYHKLFTCNQPLLYRR